MEQCSEKLDLERDVVKKMGDMQISASATPELVLSVNEACKELPGHCCTGVLSKLKLHLPPDPGTRCCSGRGLAIGPLVTKCGHIYCGEVIAKARLQNIKRFICVGCDEDSPTGTCREVISIDELTPDKAMARTINNKIVECPYHDKGCKSTMKLRKLNQHLEQECLFESIPCPNCHKKYQRKELSDHQTTCKSKACDLAGLGCAHISDTESGDSSSTPLTHNAGVHLALIYQILASVRDVAQFSSRSINGAVNSLSCMVTGQEQAMDMLSRPGEQQAKSYSIAELKKNYNSKHRDASEARERYRTIIHQEYPMRVAETVLRAKRRSQYQERQEEENCELMKDFMKETLEAPLLLNHGSVIYKIPNFSELRTKAIKGDLKRGVYGPRCYTHEYGYLVQPIVYPNGDGVGAGTHVSVFIALRKGRWDALLHWPMVGRVVISLLSQKKVGHETVTHSFQTDLASLSYHRPSGDMNQASGIPRALDLNLLKQPSDFLVDDTLFIEIQMKPSLMDW